MTREEAESLVVDRNQLAQLIAENQRKLNLVENLLEDGERILYAPWFIEYSGQDWKVRERQGFAYEHC